MNYLTLEELSAEIERSPDTLKKHFERTRDNLAKKGIIIKKYGSGKTGKYTVEYKDIEE